MHFFRAVEIIYINVLVHGYKIANVSEIRPNEFMVVMKNNVHTKCVLLIPKFV